MNIVKIPKKLKDIFQEIRNGNIESGIEKLKNFPDFETQKNVVFAEINYYKNEFENAMQNDENALLNNEQWYAGNILTEHFFAYTFAAIKINEIERAEKFYNFFLEVKEQLNLPEYQINQYRYLVEQHLSKLKGNKNCLINPEPIKLIESGKDFIEIENLQKKHRPDLNNKHIEKIEYLLYFMITDCNSKEVFEFYEEYCDEIRNQNIHIDISRLYSLANQIENTEKALLNFAKNWLPVESLQIVPMQIFEYEELYPILTKELKNKILHLSKTQ